MTTGQERQPVFKSPEIDGVMVSLERAHGDGLADEYYKLIDLATGPRVAQEATQTRVAQILGKLDAEDRFITAALTHGASLFDTPNLPQTYYSVIGQVKELAQIDN